LRFPEESMEQVGDEEIKPDGLKVIVQAPTS
jgi:hypothetical protein